MNEKEIFLKLYHYGLIKTIKDNPEGWQLVSGVWSPFYIQLRYLPSYPRLLNEIGKMMGKEIEGNKLLGVAMAGIPIAAAISLNHGIPMCYTRKLAGVKSVDELEKYAKKYGEHSLVEGEIEDGDEFVVIDDIVTKFDSKLMAIKQLEIEAERRNKKIKCEHVAVVIDRQQGAAEVARKYGIKLHALIKFKEAIEWIKDEMDEKEYEIIVKYLENPEKYQK